MQTEARTSSEFTREFALRAASITMGFVFFMGGWRRFINVPAKHDITSPASLASKLVEAAPGSPVESMIHWVLAHPFIAEWSIYMMSTAEVLVGLGLMLGLFARVAATGGAGLNFALMLIFGWEGYECLDEWTMAALGFAISVSVMIYGAGRYSLDSLLKRDDFARYFGRKISLALTVFSVVFTVGFYSYYFGIFQLHKLTSVKAYHITALQVPGKPDQARLYVNAGPSAAAAYVTSIVFTLADGSTVVEPADKIAVVKSLFEPWSHHSGKVVDGVMKMGLGAMVDIRLPAGAKSAVIKMIDSKPSQVAF